MKVCSGCNETKDTSEFYKKSSSKDKLHPFCKVCTKEKCRLYYLNTRETNDLRTAKWKSENRTRANELNEISRKRNLSSLANKEARRRATKLSATPAWADQFIISEIYHLSSLRTATTGIKWAVDHIVPLNSKLVCGLHVEGNLRVIPALENLKKSNVYWPDMP